MARRYLSRRGYRTVCKNYTALGCEIDLVMKDGDTLVFVEVKTRSGHEYGYGREAVDAFKQRRLIVAAKAFIKEKAASEVPVRFDVVEVDIANKTVEHIENAFLA